MTPSDPQTDNEPSAALPPKQFSKESHCIQKVRFHPNQQTAAVSSNHDRTAKSYIIIIIIIITVFVLTNV